MVSISYEKWAVLYCLTLLENLVPPSCPYRPVLQPCSLLASLRSHRIYLDYTVRYNPY